MRHKDPELMKKIAGFVEEFYGIRNRIARIIRIITPLFAVWNMSYG